MVDYIALLQRKVLRYNGSCKPLTLTPGMVSRVLDGGKVARFITKVLCTVSPSGPCYLRGFTAKVAFIFYSCRSTFSLTGVNSLLLQYLPNFLLRYTGDRSNLSAGKMLHRVKDHYSLWFNESFNVHSYSPFYFGLRYDKVNIT